LQRNIDEVVRSVKALIFSYENSVQTPANWPNNPMSLKDENGEVHDHKGAVFLLPTVTKKDADTMFPGYQTCPVPSGKTYIRLIKLEDLGLNAKDVATNGAEKVEKATAMVKKASDPANARSTKQKWGLFGRKL
jgi:hypothetical protein